MDLAHIDSRLSKRHMKKLFSDMLKATSPNSKFPDHLIYQVTPWFNVDQFFSNNFFWYREFDTRTVVKNGVEYINEVVRYHIQFEARYSGGRHWPVKYEFLVYLNDPEHFFPRHDGRRTLTPDSLDKWLTYHVLDHDSIVENGTAIPIYL